MSILQIRRFQKKDADLDAVAASGVAAAWTAYTPTVTANSGTFTTVSATGKYLVMGKISFVAIVVTITTNGTAAGAVRATLPNTCTGNFILAGRDSLTGKMLQGYITVAAPTMAQLFFYDGLYPGASGTGLIASGCYENT